MQRCELAPPPHSEEIPPGAPWPAVLPVSALPCGARGTDARGRRQQALRGAPIRCECPGEAACESAEALPSSPLCREKTTADGRQQPRPPPPPAAPSTSPRRASLLFPSPSPLASPPPPLAQAPVAVSAAPVETEDTDGLDPQLFPSVQRKAQPPAGALFSGTAILRDPALSRLIPPRRGASDGQLPPACGTSLCRDLGREARGPHPTRRHRLAAPALPPPAPWREKTIAGQIDKILEKEFRSEGRAVPLAHCSTRTVLFACSTPLFDPAVQRAAAT